MLEFLRSWHATSVGSGRTVKVAVQIGAPTTEDQAKTVPPPMPEVAPSRSAESSGRVGLISDAAIELQDMSQLETEQVSVPSAASASTGGETADAQNDYLNARPSWMRSAR